MSEQRNNYPTREQLAAQICEYELPTERLEWMSKERADRIWAEWRERCKAGTQPKAKFTGF